MPDMHAFALDIDDEYIGLTVTCPYDQADATRPCWPHHMGEDGEMVPDDPPQTECVYESWVDNMSIDEMLHGKTTVPLPTAWMDWSNGDYPVVQL